MMRKNTLFSLIVISFLAVLVPTAQARTIHAEWTAQNIPGIDGYRLYHQNNLACDITDPNATSVNCEVDIADGETWFTLTYYMEDGTESGHSAPISYTLASDLQAAITVDSIEGPAPLQVVFDASTSTGNISTYEWSFGDGDTATGTPVNHTFTSQGNYTATLKITDNKGNIDQETITIVATGSPSPNNAPVAVLSSSVGVGKAPLLVTFDAGGSSDSDGTIISFQWDMGDGSTATGAQVTHTYTVAGTYNPTLTVTDDGGLTDSASTPVLVEPPMSGNTPPTAVISASATQGKAPLEINFDAGNSTDPDGSIVSYNWDFGDGTTATGATASHTFTQPAEYTVSLTVVDNSSAASQPATVVINTDETNGEQPPEKINILPIINLLLLDSESN